MITSPDLGSTNLKSDLPTVDLPHPDSPTSAKVQPRFIKKDTFSTA